MGIEGNCDFRDCFEQPVTPKRDGNYYFSERPSVPANSIYIATDGEDSPGRGGISDPYLTVPYAIADNPAALSFVLRAGTYNQQYTLENGINALHIPLSGTDSANRCIIQGFPGETVILDQGGLANGIAAFDKDWFLVDNMIIRNTYGDANDDVGGVFTNNCSEGIIQNCEIFNVDGVTGSNVGAIRTDNSHDILIFNNLLHDVTVGGVSNANAACVHGFGQYNITVIQNTMYNANRGLYHKDSAGKDVGTFGYTLERNIIRNVDDGCFYDLAGSGGDPHNSQYVRQCLFYEISTNAVHLDASDAATDPSRNNKLLECTNNVLDANGTTRNMFWVTNCDSAILYNNIMFNALVQDAQRYEKSLSGSYTITESDYNRFHTTVRYILDLFDPSQQIISSLGDWQNEGYDLNSTQADPLFVDSANRDYHLQGTSTLIGTGKNGDNYGLYLTGAEQIGSTLGG